MTPTPADAREREALLPCPFCRALPAIGAVARDWWKLRIDHAEGCFLDGRADDVIVPQDDESRQHLVELWNRRATLATGDASPALCRRCGGEMRPGIAMGQTTYTGSEGTCSPAGPGHVVECSKCSACGWSVAAAGDAVSPVEPAAWRIRYRSEPGMIGHYPWSYVDKPRGPYRQPAYEYQPLHTSPPPAVEAQAAPEDYLLNELINITARFKAAVIQAGTDEEFAELAVKSARAAIAKATGATPHPGASNAP